MIQTFVFKIRIVIVQYYSLQILIELEEDLQELFGDDCARLEKIDGELTCKLCAHRYPTDSSLSSCKLGIVENHTFVQTRFLPREKIVVDCHSDCRECAGSGSDECSSCFAGKYVSQANGLVRGGSCLDKTDDHEIIELFVRKESTESDVQLRVGSLANPFLDLQNAIQKVKNDEIIFCRVLN